MVNTHSLLNSTQESVSLVSGCEFPSEQDCIPDMRCDNSFSEETLCQGEITSGWDIAAAAVIVTP